MFLALMPKLNPETQIVTTLGSKEGFANVAQAITAPGDVVLVQDRDPATARELQAAVPVADGTKALRIAEQANAR